MEWFSPVSHLRWALFRVVSWDPWHLRYFREKIGKIIRDHTILIHNNQYYIYTWNYDISILLRWYSSCCRCFLATHFPSLPHFPGGQSLHRTGLTWSVRCQAAWHQAWKSGWDPHMEKEILILEGNLDGNSVYQWPNLSLVVDLPLWKMMEWS